MQHVHQIRVAHRTPKRLTFGIAGRDLDLDSRDTTIAHPRLRLLDEQAADPSPAQFGPNPEVGDFRALRLFENRRRAIDAHDTQTLWRAVAIVDQNLCIGVAMQRAQEFAQLAFGHRARAHSEERIEGRVMFGDQRPERGHPIDLAQPRNPHPPGLAPILLGRFASGHPGSPIPAHRSSRRAVVCSECSAENLFRARVAWLHSPGSLSPGEPCSSRDDRRSPSEKPTQFKSLIHELHFASGWPPGSCTWHMACAMKNGVVCPCWTPSFPLDILLLEPTSKMSKMSKLWIVHRSPQQRASFARLSGLAESELVAGAPDDDDFVAARTPAAIVLGLEGDFERELEFAHRNRARLTQARWLLVCAPEDTHEARRLFRTTNPEVMAGPPTARMLRAFIAAAAAHRSSASLAERQQRQRVAKRFSAWLGGVEVPGLLRALDPSLMSLPLLVRGVPGSGRSLLCHYVEIFRSAHGPVLRLHGRDLREPNDLVRRLRESQENGQAPIHSVWIDEVDALSISTQNTLADWITHGSSPEGVVATGLRWIATAGAAGFDDQLEPGLGHAFAPLLIEVPALADHPETLAAFAEEVARDWTHSVGGVTRQFADSALMLLEAHPWSGDRAELEAVLRTSLAASSRDLIEDVDLRFPSDPVVSESMPPAPAEPIDAIRALTAAPGVVPVPVVEAEAETTEDPEALESALFEAAQTTETAPIAAVELGARSIPGESTSSDESTRLSEASFDLVNQPTPAPRTPSRSPSQAAQLKPDQSWRRLARSLSHEIRNPLVSIRTFVELLPEHFDDETFRARFTELVGKDVAHISDVLTRLSSIAEREPPEAGPVDVSSLIEQLLEDRRERIARGRLLVLRELERDAPFAWADAHGLRVALEGLLDRALESLPERGDLFVATRRIERAADGKPRLRILLRHHNPVGTGQSDAVLAELDPTANVLEYVLAETVIEASGGSLTVDATDARETLILIDLQTPSKSGRGLDPPDPGLGQPNATA